MHEWYALERGNYRWLKLADKILKIVETVIEKFIIKKVDIDEVQFGFMPGCGTANAILIYSCRRNI